MCNGGTYAQRKHVTQGMGQSVHRQLCTVRYLSKCSSEAASRSGATCHCHVLAVIRFVEVIGRNMKKVPDWISFAATMDPEEPSKSIFRKTAMTNEFSALAP